MIDTIVISIPQDKFQILNHKRFSPSTEGFFFYPFTQMGGKTFIKAVQNPPKCKSKNDKYLPRLTVIKAIRKGGYVIELKIELSLPKIFFGNNFDELRTDNFEQVTRLICRGLKQMEINVLLKDLEEASVSSVHYSKNIHLKNHTSCSMIINELHKIDLPSRIDIGTERFRNGGHALHYHTNTRDIVFYDKIKDLEKAKGSEKRSVEKDNAIQLSLFNDIPNPKALQVFRMEVRLGNRQEIKRTFAKAEIKTELTFKCLFKKSVSQKVLTYFWDEIKESSNLLNVKTEGVFDLAETLKANNPTLKTQKILEYVGFLILGREGSTKRLRNFLGYEGSPNANRKWYALKKTIKELKYNRDGNYQAIDEVSVDLINYDSLKFSNFSQND